MRFRTVFLAAGLLTALIAVLILASTPQPGSVYGGGGRIERTVPPSPSPEPTDILITQQPETTPPSTTISPPATNPPPVTTLPETETQPPSESPPQIPSPEELIEEISGRTSRFSSFTRDQQEALLGMPWIQDGLDGSDIEYLENLPIDFDPTDRLVDRDNGGWPDIYEIGVRGDISRGADDNSLEILETEYAQVVYYDRVKPRFIREVVLAVEEAAARNIRVLGGAPKVRVSIYFDREEFKEAYSGEIDNVIGFASKGEMHVLSPEYLVYRTKDEFSRVIIHEYSHLATPWIRYAWLSEGYAKYISKEPYYGQISGCIDYGFPLSFDYGETDREVYRTYDCGQNLVEYIAGTRSEAVLGEAAKKGFADALGLTESEFIAEYKANLKISLG